MSDHPTDLPLRCRCGHVQALACNVTPSGGLRFICYCGDCQAFARFLDRPDVLDAAGGTDIFHLPAGRVKFTSGVDALRCVSFSGKVLRWYASCCRTPIANGAASSRFPVIGLIHSFMAGEASGPSRDQLLGRPICRIHERSATAPLRPDAPPRLSLGIVIRRISKVLGWWMRGLGRPNPFFDEHTNAPVSAPQHIDRRERSSASSSSM
jgi:Family of unknown function (DUF6151)